MSYPRKLHILVIEDDPEAIEGYRAFFPVCRKSFQIVEPIIARSFADAMKRIDGPEIFHVVLVDLNLPIATRDQPAEGLAPGEQLLEALAKRDSHPVPVVLVVSGKLGLAQPISGLQDRLTKDFWHGRLVNKGLGQYQEIEAGLSQALRYVDVGVHIQDAGKQWFPTLSPREDDLLRRCILSQESSLGVNVRWWSAESGQSVTHPSPNRGPTKVLMGHFLMDDGLGTSLPTFFKFEPAGNGPSACRNAALLGHKLAHVKPFPAAHGRHRSLTVTQSVTHGVPVSLNEYLQRDTAAISSHIPSLITQVVEQLTQLGAQSDDEIAVADFLWEYLDRAAMEKVWKAVDTRQHVTQGGMNPLTTFDWLKASQARTWTTRRACAHGDLNATNVAIDAAVPSNPQAYIFDAGWMKADIEFRDLATLEITSVLFNSEGIDEQLIHACRIFYDREFSPTSLASASAVSPFSQNVRTMISAIRSRFQTDQQRTAYALLVFSSALQQLSGLGIQSSPNKVRNPLHACWLAAWVTQWLSNVVPDLFPDRVQPKTPLVEQLA